MAGINGSIIGADVSLAAATAKTVLQLTAPTNQRLVIQAISVWFEGVSSVETPVKIRIGRNTTVGTFTPVTPINRGVGTETLQATAAKNASAEPTYGDILSEWRIHPQSGMPYVFPIGQELIIPGGGRLGIECTAVAIVECTAQIDYEE